MCQYYLKRGEVGDADMKPDSWNDFSHQVVVLY